ncbi:MAG: hypothetical protein N3A60_09015 [Thermanaerothrix sp.]|nr:hypothetical protein [Thermanaerothrix sp.]
MTPGFLGYRWLRRLFSTPTSPTRGWLRSIRLRVENLPMQRALFIEGLGLPLTPGLSDREVALSLGEGLELILQDAAISPQADIELTFEVPNIELARTHLRRNGYNNLEENAGGDCWYHPPSKIVVRLKPLTIPPNCKGEGQ